jgi:cholest-4-en-3-one 26-monooxygenase
MPQEALEQQRMMMLNMDPPMHTRYRRLVNKGFTPRMVQELADTLRTRTTDIIDRVADRGECDFVVDVAAELPLQAIADILGVPQEDRHKMFDWSNRMVGADDPEYGITEENQAEASMELFAYAHGLAAARQQEPGEDLISVLLKADVDGERLTELELDLFFLMLTVAGNETTRNLISHGMVALLENPDQLELVRRDRSLLPSAVDEMLRWASPVINFRRTATADTELGGQQIKKGDKVVIFYISANRDEKVFADPFKFDVTRSPNEHVAFGGGGPHYCLGANLAKLEINIMFNEVLDRLDDIELAGDVQRLRSNFINGLKHVPVKFNAKR